MARILDGGSQALAQRLAGTFSPTPDLTELAQRAGALARAVHERAQRDGALRRAAARPGGRSGRTRGAVAGAVNVSMSPGGRLSEGADRRR